LSSPALRTPIVCSCFFFSHICVSYVRVHARVIRVTYITSCT